MLSSPLESLSSLLGMLSSLVFGMLSRPLDSLSSCSGGLAGLFDAGLSTGVFQTPLGTTHRFYLGFRVLGFRVQSSRLDTSGEGVCAGCSKQNWRESEREREREIEREGENGSRTGRR